MVMIFKHAFYWSKYVNSLARDVGGEGCGLTTESDIMIFIMLYNYVVDYGAAPGVHGLSRQAVQPLCL